MLPERNHDAYKMQIQFDKIKESHLIDTVVKFVNLALDRVELEMNKPENQNALDRGDMIEGVLTRGKTGLIIERGSNNQKSTRYSFRPILTLTTFGRLKIFQEILGSNEFKHEWQQLFDWGLFPDAFSIVDNFWVFPFGRMVERCMDQYYEEDSNPRLSEVEDILVDEAFVRPVVTKILDLERHREIELEYWYFIYGIRLQGNDQAFDPSRENTLLIATDSKLEELSLKMNIRGESGGGINMGAFDFLSNCSGWIHGQKKIPYDALSRHNPKENYAFQLIPPEYFEEAFYMLGFSEVKVRFFSKSSENSRYSLNLTIYPGFTSYSFSPYRTYSRPDWVARELFWNHPDARAYKLDLGSVQFLNHYGAFRQDQGSNPFAAILFTRFARMVTFTSLWDKVIETVIILEMILLSGYKQKCARLRKRISHILGEGDAEYILLSELVKQIYHMRNDIVHAGGESLFVLLKVFPIKRVDDFLFHLVRCILLRFLRDDGITITFPQKAEIRASLQNLAAGVAPDLPGDPHYRMALDLLRQIFLQAGKPGT